jgi:hypothetical protein
MKFAPLGRSTCFITFNAADLLGRGHRGTHTDPAAICTGSWTWGGRAMPQRLTERGLRMGAGAADLLWAIAVISLASAAIGAVLQYCADSMHANHEDDE